VVVAGSAVAGARAVVTAADGSARVAVRLLRGSAAASSGKIL